MLLQESLLTRSLIPPVPKDLCTPRVALSWEKQVRILCFYYSLRVLQSTYSHHPAAHNPDLRLKETDVARPFPPAKWRKDTEDFLLSHKGIDPVIIRPGIFALSPRSTSKDGYMALMEATISLSGSNREKNLS